jgi:uncharacterized protein (DUF58 family)
LVDLKDITKFRHTPQSDKRSGALLADFKELAQMRRYVPYVKNNRFRQASTQAGTVKSSFKGRGMEFEEVRAYSYGDDVRDIDWRVTARKNQPYTKLYAEEKDREIWVWLDLSAKMRFGTKKELKSVTAAKTAALLGWMSLAQHDRFGLAVFDGQKTYLFKPDRSEEHLSALLKQIEHIAEKSLYKQADTQTALMSWQFLQPRLHARTIVFLVGSFDELTPGEQKALLPLSKGRDLYLINLYDALEVVAPPKGEYVAEFQQKRSVLISNGTHFSKNYEEYFAKKHEINKKFCSKFNISYFEIRTDFPLHLQLKLA